MNAKIYICEMTFHQQNAKKINRFTGLGDRSKSMQDYTVSIFHSSEVQTEISVSRVTVWHHEALPSDAKT